AELIARARELADLASLPCVPRPDLAVQYPLRHPAVRSVALGMRPAAQVESNAARMQARIPDAAWEAVARLESEHSPPGRGAAADTADDPTAAVDDPAAAGADAATRAASADVAAGERR